MRNNVVYTQKEYALEFIGLNGPPESGKDTLANLIVNYYSTPQKFWFIDPMKGVLLNLVEGFGVDPNSPEYVEWKNKHLSNGITGRDLLIQFSEEFLKPRLGKDILARMLVERAKKAPEPNIVVPDCGFVEEFDYLTDLGHDVTLIRIHRPGKTFEGDSRGYLERPGFDLVNYGTLGQVYSMVKLILDNRNTSIKKLKPRNTTLGYIEYLNGLVTEEADGADF